MATFALIVDRNIYRLSHSINFFKFISAWYHS